jgi:hypothetical protein
MFNGANELPSTDLSTSCRRWQSNGSTYASGNTDDSTVYAASDCGCSMYDFELSPIVQ